MRRLLLRVLVGAPAFVCAFVLLSQVGAALLISPTASAKDAAPDPKAAMTISKNVFPPLKAATEAFTAKQYEVAAKKLQEADAVDKKTPYDQFRIDELKALVYLVQNTNYAEAFAIYEKHLSTPEYLDPPQQEIRMKVLTQLAFQTQNYPKALEYGKEWIGAHPNDTPVLDLMARASYISKDYKATLDTVKKAIGINEAASKAPDELWLQLQSSCGARVESQTDVVEGYEKLVRYYPKTENWSKVLEAAIHAEKNDVAIFYILRLMADTDVITQQDIYFEYAQRAVEQALPGEALKVLETGAAKKIIGDGATKDRYQTMIADVGRKAKADKAQLPEIEKEWNSKNAKAQTGAGLGLAYFGYQMYDQAATTLAAAIEKGGLRDVDNYKMTLGIAYLRTGQKDKAREQFAAIPANSPLARISRFWVSRSYN